MLPTIKEVHARIQSLCNDGIIYEQEETIKEIDAAAKSMCNEDQGKVINFIYVLWQFKQIYIYIYI